MNPPWKCSCKSRIWNSEVLAFVEKGFLDAQTTSANMEEGYKEHVAVEGKTAYEEESFCYFENTDDYEPDI